MALLHYRRVDIGHGGPPLLQEVEFTIEKGERIGLIGRNGAGKSTLLRSLAGEHESESGEVFRSTGLRVASLSQEIPRDLDGLVGDIVADACHESRSSQSVAERWISILGLDPSARFAPLSSGQKRRVLLAKALATPSDLLLLDEPTNHLDLESIVRLEEQILRHEGSLLFITHDRTFLRKLANRIWEIDQKRLNTYKGDWRRYQEQRDAAREAEERARAEFDKKLAKEEAWIRQGIKARRTRNEGRVRALKRLREQRRERVESVGQVRMKAETSTPSGRMVFEAKDVCFAYEDANVIEDFKALILKGDKIGITGPNGAGKTTLIHLLLGKLEPQSGSIRTGTHLEVAYFDQRREQLDEDQSVQDNVSGGLEQVSYMGKTRHILSYLEDFLFTPERARTSIRNLSGGERNRLLLARLFLSPSNVLVLDEPTNDLDTETLEVLEQLLVDYPGSVLVVSHDRAFLDNTVTSIFAIAQGGKVREFVGGYADWQRALEAEAEKSNAGKPTNKTSKARPPKKNDAKLSYKETRELEALPGRIEELEEEKEGVHETMASPDYHTLGSETIAAMKSRLDEIERELGDSYARWEELEERRNPK